jgi:hypothetical protein
LNIWKITDLIAKNIPSYISEIVLMTATGGGISPEIVTLDSNGNMLYRYDDIDAALTSAFNQGCNVRLVLGNTPSVLSD